MLWENLTGPDFAKAVKETGVCVIGMGVLERHGDHLPLGQDVLAVHGICKLAAEREPAVVFPAWYFGQIYEARAFPGCVTVKPTLLLELIEAVCDEIGRNGFRKIIFVNGHGGNRFLLPLIAQCSLWQKKPYSVYIQEFKLSPERQKKWEQILRTEYHGHACECETSMALHMFPELVKMKDLPKQDAPPMNRGKDLKGLFTGIGWYADHPEHYAGDARPSTAERGRQLLDVRVDQIAEVIAAVKADKVVPALEAEFHKRAANPCATGRKGRK